ncbi:MAG: HEAT repeat domain-containing protein [Alphaproteobacteria bacterium]|nr:HEAT repeat domain-containing protein [Alphaproteobacteria bacterium]
MPAALILPWLSAPAAAQEASAARRCAMAAEGVQIEVCLRLAAENPDEVDAIVSALVAWVDRAEAPDRDILDGLLLLHSDRAVEGAQRLGALDDPRATPLLANTARTHPDVEVRLAAVAALGGHAEAVGLLQALVEDADQDLALREAAGTALGAIGTPEAADALQDLVHRTLGSPALRRHLELTLASGWPERLAGRRVAPGGDGARWLAAGAAVALGYPMTTASWFGQRDLLPVASLAGITTGASVGYGYGRAWPVEPGDAALLAVGGTGATAAGFLVGLGLSEGDPDTAWLSGLAGEVVGFGGTALARRAWKGTPFDATEGFTLAALAAGSVGTGALAFDATPEEASLLGGATLAGGLVLGPLLALPADARRDWPLVATGAVFGGVGAALLPVDADPVAMPIAGALGGAVVGGTLGAAFDPRPDLVIGAVTGGGFGAATGYGVGLTTTGRADVAGGLGLGGTVIGTGLGALVALTDPDPIDDRDVAFTGVAMGFGAWNALALAQIVDATPAQRDGAVLLATAGAGGLTTAMNLAVDAPIPDTLAATSLGVWGGYGGRLAADLFDVDDPFLIALPASDAGLLLGTVLVSPLVGTPPLVIGVADAGGAILGSAGALGASLASDDPRLVSAVTLGGALGGAAIGAALGTRWYREGGRRDMALRWPHTPPIALAPGPGGIGASVVVGPW